jgi:hypothetical protein
MYAIVSSPAPAPHRYSASAPRFASLSTITGRSSRVARSSPAAMPAHSGRMLDAATSPLRTSTGAGSPSPTPTTDSRSAPATASVASTSDAARSSTSCAAVPRSSRADCSPSTWWPRSATATRRCVRPTSTPTASPAAGDRRTSAAGRPPAGPTGMPAWVSTTSPASDSAVSAVETVARDSPVAAATSARVAGPSTRRASTSRRSAPRAGTTGWSRWDMARSVRSVVQLCQVSTQPTGWARSQRVCTRPTGSSQRVEVDSRSQFRQLLDRDVPDRPMSGALQRRHPAGYVPQLLEVRCSLSDAPRPWSR